MSNNIKTNQGWLIIFAAFLGAVLFIFYQNQALESESKRLMNGMAAKNASPVHSFKTRITIDYGNGKVRVFEGKVMSGMNMQDVFWGVEASAGIEFNVKNQEIEAVDGVKSRMSKKWNYYINEAKQDGNPLEKKIVAGDKIVLRFE